MKTIKKIINNHKIEITGPHSYDKQFSLYIDNLLIYNNLFSAREAENIAKKHITMHKGFGGVF